MAKDYELRSIAYTPMTVIAGAAKTGGDFETINDVSGFWPADVANGDSGTFIYKGQQVNCVKATGITIAAGEKAYHHTVNDNMTNSATGAVLVGRFLEAAATGATEVLVEWDGALV